MTATTGFERDNQGFFIRKDPESVMDYFVDYSTFLESGDSISTHTITADTGLTVDSSEILNGDKKIKMILSGGTENTTYDVKADVDTADGLTMIHRFRVKCEKIYLT